MKGLVLMFVLLALASIAVGVLMKFYGINLLFDNVGAHTYLVLANTCLLLSLAIKLIKD